MKFVNLQELIELGAANPNYTFSQANPSKEPGYYENFKTYVGGKENDIERDLLNYCNGGLTACQRCYINFFDAEDNYLESYQLRPSMQDLMQLEIDSWSMTFD